MYKKSTPDRSPRPQWMLVHEALCLNWLSSTSYIRHYDLWLFDVTVFTQQHKDSAQLGYEGETTAFCERQATRPVGASQSAVSGFILEKYIFLSVYFMQLHSSLIETDDWTNNTTTQYPQQRVTRCAPGRRYITDMPLILTGPHRLPNGVDLSSVLNVIRGGWVQANQHRGLWTRRTGWWFSHVNVSQFFGKEDQGK